MTTIHCGPKESKTRALDARIADLEKENGIDV